MANEIALDEMYKLQASRTAAIRKNGEDFNYENSAKRFRAVDSGDDTYYAEPHASFRKFQIITSKGGSCFVIDAEPQAGRTLIKTAPVTGRLSVFAKEIRPSGPYTKAVTTLHQKGFAVPYSSGFSVVPGTVNVGDVVFIASSKYEVVGKSYADGGLEKLHFEPYTDPSEPAVKTLKDSYAWGTGCLSNQPRQSTTFRIRH